jgi:PAS domain S-box-containing protein
MPPFPRDEIVSKVGDEKLSAFSMQSDSKVRWFAEEKRTRYLAVAAASILIIAFADWLIIPDLGFGVLYLVPLLLASAFLSRWQIACLALICAALRDLYFPAAPEKWVRLVVVYAAYVFVGLLVREMVVYRRAAIRHLRDLETEITRSHQSEEELQIVVNASPVAILTLSSDGDILRSNAAAHQVFGISPGALSGKTIESYLPTLSQRAHNGNSQRNGQPLECHGRRADGTSFLAHVWLSCRDGAAGTELTAVVVDASGNQGNSVGQNTE